MVTTTVTVPDAELHVSMPGPHGARERREGGDGESGGRRGEPLLMLHGLTGTGGDWARAFDVDALARDFRVVAPDARGHGRSTNPSGRFSIRACAEDVLAILDALGLDSVRAVGASLGAKTLLHVATMAPDRVRAMVLVSAAPRFAAQTRAVFRAATSLVHTEEEWAAMRALHPNGDAQIEALWRMPAQLADDPSDLSFAPEALRAIRARTWIVTGERDPLYPVALAEELARGIPSAELWVVPGAGHVPIFGAARAEFAARALEFLRAG